MPPRKCRPATALLLLLCAYALPAAAEPDELGSHILTGVVPLAAYGIAHFKDDDEGEKQWLYSTGLSLVLNSAARLAFNDTELGPRPNGHPYGFPSGHTSFVVSGAAFLQERYGWKYGVPGYLAAGYISYVRVETHHHHWRDIIAAAALSWGVAEFIVTPYEDTRVTPVVGPDVLGVKLEYSW